MSSNPFRADPAVRERIAALEAERGPAVRTAIAEALARTQRNVSANLGGVLLKAEADAIAVAHGLAGDELMLLALKHAEGFAKPDISKFFVGSVGREAGTGNLVFGGNLEFRRGHIGNTVHGEGFVLTRAFSRGTAIETIAIGEAHPCAHCRQYLSEFAATTNLTLIDPLGHRLKMADLYPWPFDPDYLGETGIVAGTVYRPELTLSANTLPVAVAEKLTEVGRRSYTPYSKSPAAVVLTLADGALIAGAAIESVSFNPTMSPMQAAIIDLFAHGYDVSDIVGAAAVHCTQGAVDYLLHACDLLEVVAPDVSLEIVVWA